MSWRIPALLIPLLSLAILIAIMVQDPDSGTATWDATRSAGFAAYLLLWVSVVSGMSIHLRLRPTSNPLTFTLEVHRITSTLGVSFIFAHVFALLLDPVVPFRVWDLVIPFWSEFRPLQVGLGTLAQWLLLVVLGSTAISGNLPYGLWRKLHLLSFPCYVLALVHGITSGTDSASPFALVIYATTTAIVAAVGVLRVAGRGWVTAAEAAATQPLEVPVRGAPRSAAIKR
jgi:predicted ferric reductase